MNEQSEQFSIDEQQQKKIEKSKEKRARAYLDILSSSKTSDEKIIEKQTLVFKELPDLKNLSRLISAGLIANRVEYPGGNVPDKLIIQGILFEELVKIENNVTNLSSEKPKNIPLPGKFDEIEKGKVEASLDEQLTTLFHNPGRFNYKELSHLRNPDISFVETDIDGKTLKVVGVGEAKSSYRLDQRCLIQFKRFHQNLNKVADFINQRDDCEEHGIRHFGIGKDKTTIKINSEDTFNQYLIVTRDMDIDIRDPQKKFKLSGEGALTQTEQELFSKMIQEGKIKILKSSFSHQELDLLVEKIERNISEEDWLAEAEFQAEQESL